MSGFTENAISAKKVQFELKQLLDTYLSEKEENRRDKDEQGMEYWESACQTIQDVAAALHIPLEVKPNEQPESA